MDDVFIQQVLDGDIQAFRHLVKKYKDPSFNLARSILKSDLTAEEAVQDAFVKAFQNLHKFRKKAAFSTWFYRIVVNESLRKLKKKQLEFQKTDDDDRSEKEYAVDPEVLDYLHEEEQKEIINSLLDRLSPSESLLLKLFYLEEKKTEEISGITGQSLVNIKVTLHRARKHFALLYQQQFENKNLMYEK